MRILNIWVRKLDLSRNYSDKRGCLWTPSPRLRWNTEQRLEFIEFRLFWEGRVNRSDITDMFGVSVPQASNDLAQYRELAPTNIHYDASEKRYLPTPDFQPKYLKPNAERYLAQLKAISEHVIALADTWITELPASRCYADPNPAG